MLSTMICATCFTTSLADLYLGLFRMTLLLDVSLNVFRFILSTVTCHINIFTCCSMKDFLCYITLKVDVDKNLVSFFFQHRNLSFYQECVECLHPLYVLNTLTFWLKAYCLLFLILKTKYTLSSGCLHSICFGLIRSKTAIMIAWHYAFTDWEWFFCAFLGAGVPQPSVSWHHLEGKLSANIISLTNGSLLLHNLTLQDDGTYSCVASNPIGKASASSRIHVVGVLLNYFPAVSRLCNCFVLFWQGNQWSGL